MYFIAARKSDKKIIEVGSNSLDLADIGIRDKFLSALSANHAISVADISLYPSTDAESFGTVLDGGEYSAVWSGDTVVGVDITAEQSKRFVRAVASKSEIIADGVDETLVTLQVWKADGTAIDTNVTLTTDVPIGTPDGVRKVSVRFVNGTASRTFKTTKSGSWVFPLEMKRYKQVRIDSVAHVEALLDFDNL